MLVTQNIEHTVYIDSIAYETCVAESYVGIAVKLMESYYEKHLQLIKVSNLSSENLLRDMAEVSQERINWLEFKIDNAEFALGLDGEWGNSLGIKSLIECLLKYKSEKLEQNRTVSLDFCQNTIYNFDRLNLIELDFKSESQISKLWIQFSSLPKFLKPLININNNWQFKLPLYLDLDASNILGNTSFFEISIVLPLSNLSSNLKFDLSTKLSHLSKQQILKLKGNHMNNNQTLKTLIRLGFLELKIDDLIALKKGGTVRFTLPDRFNVELEVAGQIVGKAELSREERAYVLNWVADSSANSISIQNQSLV